MAHFEYDSVDFFTNNLINGNIKDCKKYMQGLSREHRYKLLSCLHSDPAISASTLWEVIRWTVEGNFK